MRSFCLNIIAQLVLDVDLLYYVFNGDKFIYVIQLCFLLPNSAALCAVTAVAELIKELEESENKITAEGNTEIGDPKVAICDEVEKLNVQLLIVGSHGRGALTRKAEPFFMFPPWLVRIVTIDHDYERVAESPSMKTAVLAARDKVEDKIKTKTATIRMFMTWSDLDEFIEALIFIDDKVTLWVNKVGPYNNPQETYNFYSLPFYRQADHVAYYFYFLDLQVASHAMQG
ncbi:transmembrane 9 superfamily member 1-like protein, partial [Tanacetum coccineum]